MADKSTKLDYVNAVRGIAILMVIFLHVSRAVKGLPDWFSYVCAKGSYGVQLFFLASAYTLLISYGSRLKKEGEHANRNFFIRRFFRISPMYYLAAVIYSVVFFYLPNYNDGKPLAIWKVLANIFYVNEFIPGTINYVPPGGWSVGVEMLFYCCLPILYLKIRNFKTATIWFAILAAASFLLKIIIRYTLIHFSINYRVPESWFLYFWFPNQCPVFFLGIMLFFAVRKYKVRDKIAAYITMGLSTMLMLTLSYYMPVIDPYFVLPEHIIVAAFLAINVFLLAQHKMILFNNKITRFLGEISFSLYLVHFLVIYFIGDYLPLPANPFLGYFTLLLTTLIISSAISRFTYKFVEIKGIAFGDKFTRSKPPAASLNPGI